MDAQDAPLHVWGGDEWTCMVVLQLISSITRRLFILSSVPLPIPATNSRHILPLLLFLGLILSPLLLLSGSSIPGNARTR